MSGRWALGAGRTSTESCEICQGPTKPGAPLCAQCKAALRRARQVTVSQLYPRKHRASAPAAEQRIEAESRTKRKALPQPKPKHKHQHKPAPQWRYGVTLVLAVAAMAAGGYLVLYGARAGAGPAAVWNFVVPWLTPASGSESTLPPPRREPDSEIVLKAVPPPLAVAPAPVPANPVTVASPAKVTSKRAVEPPPASMTPAVARFAAATEPPDPVPVPVPQVVAPPAPPPDRWQLMAEAIARCGRENFVAGVICEQKVRLQYCDGYWGQVAQCPSGIVNDHGQ